MKPYSGSPSSGGRAYSSSPLSSTQSNASLSLCAELSNVGSTWHAISLLTFCGNLLLAAFAVVGTGVAAGVAGSKGSEKQMMLTAVSLAAFMFLFSITTIIHFRRRCGSWWTTPRFICELLCAGTMMCVIGPWAVVSNDGDNGIVVGTLLIAYSVYYMIFSVINYFFLSPHFAAPVSHYTPTRLGDSDTIDSSASSTASSTASSSCCSRYCCSNTELPAPPWFAFPACVLLTLEWCLLGMLLGLIVSQSTHSIIRGVGLVTASLSLTMVTVCLASVLYGVIARNLLLIVARIGCIIMCTGEGIVGGALDTEAGIYFIFIPLALLGVANELWRRFVVAGHLEQEELAVLLPVHTKNAVEIPQLLEEATRSNWAIDAKDVRFLRKIGTGGFGEVWIGKWKGTTAAIKKMHSMVSAESLREFCREASILATLRHPHVISLYGAAVGTQDLMLVMEYAQNGSLYDLLHNADQHLPFEVRMKMGLDAAKGMEYLHSQDPIIIHRDFKSLNLLVMSDMTVKVSDFGTSKWIQQTATMTANVGSAMWSAPEVLRFSKYSQQADIYSFGIVMWELMTRRDVFPGMLGFQIAIEVGTKGLRPELPSEEECPITEMSALMQRAWAEDPHARPSFSEIVAEMESILEVRGEGSKADVDVDVVSVRIVWDRDSEID